MISSMYDIILLLSQSLTCYKMDEQVAVAMDGRNQGKCIFGICKVI